MLKPIKQRGVFIIPTTKMNIRMDSEVKNKRKIFFSTIARNMTITINIFLRQTIRKQSIPFELNMDTPNTKTIQDFEEVNKLLQNSDTKCYKNTEELFSDLNRT